MKSVIARFIRQALQIWLLLTVEILVAAFLYTVLRLLHFSEDTSFTGTFIFIVAASLCGTVYVKKKGWL